MNKKIILIILAVLVAQAGFYAAFKGFNSGQQMQGPPAVGVAVMTVLKQPVSYQYELPGRVTPFRQSQVRPQVDGIVAKRLFEEGAQVAQGQQLYQIDDARQKAALNSAIADLKAAQSNVKSVKARLERYKDLVKINAVSRQDYDDAKAQYDQAKANIAVAQAAVDVAEVNLGYTKVYAPIAGRISRSFVTEGALVTANQADPLAVITQLDPVYVDMRQSGDDLIQMRKRMVGKTEVPVVLGLGSEEGNVYDHKGNLQFSEVTVDETTGSIALRAIFPNPDGVLLPGLFVRAEASLGQQAALLVPQRATSRGPDGSLTAWIVDENNKAQPRTLTVEQAYKDQWIVTKGISQGDRLIVLGYQKLKPDTLVKTEAWADAPKPVVEQTAAEETSGAVEQTAEPVAEKAQPQAAPKTEQPATKE